MSMDTLPTPHQIQISVEWAHHAAETLERCLGRKCMDVDKDDVRAALDSATSDLLGPARLACTVDMAKAVEHLKAALQSVQDAEKRLLSAKEDVAHVIQLEEVPS